VRLTTLIVTAAVVAAVQGCSDRSQIAAKPDSPAAAATPAPTPSLPPPKPQPVETVAPNPVKRATVTLAPEPLTPPFTLSTLSGVYTKAEAAEGSTLYMGFCASCHAAISHTGPVFRQHWAGRPLADLYDFMRTKMPKNDPGSLDEYQYGVLLAYILQMNQMPAGKNPIMGETVDLTKIRMDTVRSGSRHQ
jgi:S-disulfanyl-L-cysteine oxidoreductase SoxD